MNKSLNRRLKKKRFEWITILSIHHLHSGSWGGIIAKLNSIFNFNFSLSFELSLALLSNIPTRGPQNIFCLVSNGFPEEFVLWNAGLLLSKNATKKTIWNGIHYIRHKTGHLTKYTRHLISKPGSIKRTIYSQYI